MRTHRKQPPQAAKNIWEAHSIYTAGLGVPDRRRYRRTPPGAPTAADLVRPGDTVSTSYSTGGVVIGVKDTSMPRPQARHCRISRSSTCRPIEPRSTAIPISIGSTSALPSETAS
jgi:hypothetical protein